MPRTARRTPIKLPVPPDCGTIPRLRCKKVGRNRYAVTTLSGRDHYLGRWGEPDATEAYARLIQQWLAAGRRLPEAVTPDEPISVNEVALRFIDHADRLYCARRGYAKLMSRTKIPVRTLRERCGLLPARDFGPLALQQLRDVWVSEGLCRTTINEYTATVQRLFTWAASVELVPGSVAHGLKCLRGLRRGETVAPEPRRVGPVDAVTVARTLRHLPAPLRVLVRLLWRTGMRCGEAVQMTTGNIDRRGAVWLFRPGQHKNEHREQDRVIALGPRCQRMLAALLRPDEPDRPLFSPRDTVAAVRARRLAERRTPFNVGNRAGSNRRRRPRRTPGDWYTPNAVRVALWRAADLAFPPPAPLARQRGERAAEHLARLSDAERAGLRRWRKAHRWGPHRLRHAAASRIREVFGLEAAQHALGHAGAAVTLRYAERSTRVASDVAAALG
jgi:integrase